MLLAAVLEVSSGAAATGAPRWSAHGPEGGTISTLEVDPARPSVLYAGTHGAGVFRSSDAGRTWQRSSDGLPPDTLVLALELAPSKPTTLYLEAYAGQRLYRSADGARSWHELPPVDAGIADLDVDPARPDTVYIATHEGLMRSADGGSSPAGRRASTSSPSIHASRARSTSRPPTRCIARPTPARTGHASVRATSVCTSTSLRSTPATPASSTQARGGPVSIGRPTPVRAGRMSPACRASGSAISSSEPESSTRGSTTAASTEARAVAGRRRTVDSSAARCARSPSTRHRLRSSTRGR